MSSLKNYEEKSSYMDKIFDESKIIIKNEISLNILDNFSIFSNT